MASRINNIECLACRQHSHERYTIVCYLDSIRHDLLLYERGDWSKRRRKINGALPKLSKVDAWELL